MGIFRALFTRERGEGAWILDDLRQALCILSLLAHRRFSDLRKEFFVDIKQAADAMVLGILWTALARIS